jgi:hypothetical protein
VCALVATLPSKINLDDMSDQAPGAEPPSESGECSAASWHARAEEIRAMADTLPSDASRALMPKIAAIYDEVASEAGWSRPHALPTDDLGRQEAPQAAAPLAESRPAEHLAFPPDDPELEDELPAVTPSRDPRATERIAFPRRSQSAGRPRSTWR